MVFLPEIGDKIFRLNLQKIFVVNFGTKYNPNVKQELWGDTAVDIQPWSIVRARDPTSESKKWILVLVVESEFVTMDFGPAFEKSGLTEHDLGVHKDEAKSLHNTFLGDLHLSRNIESFGKEKGRAVYDQYVRDNGKRFRTRRPTRCVILDRQMLLDMSTMKNHGETTPDMFGYEYNQAENIFFRKVKVKGQNGGTGQSERGSERQRDCCNVSQRRDTTDGGSKPISIRLGDQYSHRIKPWNPGWTEVEWVPSVD